MASKQVIGQAVLVALVLLLGCSDARPKPDSAGIVEMVNGLAYGGIPYGSVSGNLAATSRAHYAQNSLLLPDASVLVPDTRSVVATPVLSPLGY